MCLLQGVVSRIWTKLSTKSPNDASVFLESHEQMLQVLEKQNLNHVLVFLDFMSNHSGSDKNNLSSLSILPKSKGNKYGSISIQSQIQDLHYTLNPIQKLSITENKVKQNGESGVIPYSDNGMAEMVQDVIFAMVGVSGKYLQLDPSTGEFQLNAKNNKISKINATMMLRLAKVGYYFNQVKKYVSTTSGCMVPGLIGQGMVSALERELSNYRAMIAMLQDQLNLQKMENEVSDPLTLLKVQLWASEPLFRLQSLSDILTSVGSETQVGQIITTVYMFTCVGHPTVRIMAKEILISMWKPMQHIILNWLLNGEILDPMGEFFIEEVPDVPFEKLWDQRYGLSPNKLPSFISPVLAEKILVTGKTHNYLRVVCQNKSVNKDADTMRKTFENNTEALFAITNDTVVHAMIEKAYVDTSKNLLDVVLEQHRLVLHLTALKKFLLLGQGDFIGNLMQNVKAELDRPAKDLYRHDLHSIMCSALRSSSVQFEDQEVLENLDVYLLDPFDGDLGWDTFTLQYRVDGALLTILSHMDEYRVIFKPLWNMKRIEFILQNVWKEQTLTLKRMRFVSDEIKIIQSRLSICTSEMIHFIYQVQYYTMFEVIECSWTTLLEHIKTAATLDEVVKQHAAFLERIRLGMFLQDSRKDLFTAMESVINAIMKLEKWQDNFLTACLLEEKERLNFERQIKVSEKRGTYGYTSKQRIDRDEKAKYFEASMTQYLKNLDSISKEYNKHIRQFIYKLTASNSNDLQLFGIRLDFNEYYKAADQNLKMSLTIEHLRQSAMFRSKTSIGGSVSGSQSGTEASTSSKK